MYVFYDLEEDLLDSLPFDTQCTENETKLIRFLYGSQLKKVCIYCVITVSMKFKNYCCKCIHMIMKKPPALVLILVNEVVLHSMYSFM